jgi:hypothetical protein
MILSIEHAWLRYKVVDPGMFYKPLVATSRLSNVEGAGGEDWFGGRRDRDVG